MKQEILDKLYVDFEKETRHKLGDVDEYGKFYYITWLEKKASRDSRQLSAVPNWNFCPNCGLKWEKDSEAFGCWKCNYVRH